MTHIFKKCISIILLFATGISYASCPAGYTTSTNTIDGVVFTVCYPAIIYLDANDGEFTVYATITNTTGAAVSSVGLFCYARPNVSEFTFVSSSCTSTGGAPTICNSSTVAPTGICTDGVGQINYTTSIAAGGTVTNTGVAKATTIGTYSYTPVAAVGAIIENMPSITLTVMSTCPSVTASNGMGATSCSQATSTGSLADLVTGGQAPYTFAATGTAVDGTVSITSGGVYSFTPNVAGPTTGSFVYQAVDTFGCPSNTAAILIPIVPGPSAGSAILYTTAYGTPVTGTLNFSGGTPPYTIQTVSLLNGSVTYSGNQFTFTQFDPGASYFTYSVTDANGCGFSDSAKILIYSCEPGNEVSASLDIANSLIYSLCTPPKVNLNTPFQIVASISNPDPVNSFGASVFADLIPDSSQPSAAGLSYQSNDGVPANTLFITMGSQLREGGKGTLTVTASGGVGPNTDYSITMNILPTMTGLWGYTAAIVSNPNLSLPFLSIDVISCNPYTAGNTGIVSCNNVVAGNLSSLVTGGSGPYSFFETGTPSCGQVSIATNGSFLYTAPVGYTGPCTFEYYTTDTNTCPSATGLVTITANQGPVASDTDILVCENTTFTGSLLSLVSGGTPPYTFAIVTNGTLGTATITNPTTGAYDYVPNLNAFGFDSFTFQVTDAKGCVSNVGSVSITLNQAPTASNTGLSSCVNTPTSGDLADLVSGVNFPFHFTGIGPVSGGSVTIDSDGTFQFTPSAGFSGLGSFEYLVTDASGCTATGVVDITVSSPVVAPSGISLCTNVPASGNLASLVSSGFPPYTFGPTGVSLGGSATVSSTGIYSFTPTSGFVGDASFSYQVTDSVGCIGTGSITIDYAGPIASAGLATTCENTTLTGNLTATGGTPPYTFAIVTNGTLGTVTITNSTTGAFTYVPNADTFGIDSFTFQVTDSTGCVSNIAAFQVTIFQAPVTSLTGIKDCVNNPVSGSLLSLVTAGTPPYGFSANGSVNGMVTIGSTGLYTFLPTAGFSGAASFGYLVTDSNSCTATGAVDVTVSSPIAASTGIFTCLNTPVNGSVASLVSRGFPPYTFGLTGLPVGGTASVSPTGLYDFVPTAGFSGAGGLVYEVTDTNGCIATAPVNITVDSLVGNNASVVSCTDTYVSNLMNYITGGTGALSFSGPLSMSCGSVSISPTGLFIYTGVSGFTGPCDFVYQVFDGLGCSSTGAVTVTANTAPTVSDGAISTCQDVAVSDSLAGLLNEMPQPPLTFVIVTDPTHGTLTSFNASTGAYTYTPQAGFSGIDSFQFQVTDSSIPPCTTNVGTVTITVNPAPIASNGSASTCRNTTLSGSLVDLISSGTEPYTFTQVGSAVNGIATVDANGSYTFVPTSGFIGMGSFRYQVTDVNGCVSNVGTLTVNILICCPVSTNQLMIDILEQYWGLTGL